jgi:hypothetical protein
MFRFYLLLATLFILTFATTAQAGPMVYFNNKSGIVLDEDKADVKFGMTLSTVRSLLKQGVKLTSEKGVKSLSFYFRCLAEDCTIEDGAYTSMSFINDRLVSILLMTQDADLGMRYVVQAGKMYAQKLPHKVCEINNPILNGKVMGWAGEVADTYLKRLLNERLFTTISVFTAGKGGAITIEFRTDKFRFDFDQPLCQ